MKKAGKILIALLTIIFLWILIIPLNPITLNGGLVEKYEICNVSDLNSWEPVQALFESIQTEKSFNPTVPTSIQLTYLNTKERPLIKCAGAIPSYTLYKAKTLNARIKINQPTEFGISFHKINIGPGWVKKITTEEINQPIKLTWPLERDGSGIVLKLNWLSGDFDGAALSFDQFDHSKPLNVTIYEIYLK